nr:hypothetical protein [Sphingomonas suaedae]
MPQQPVEFDLGKTRTDEDDRVAGQQNFIGAVEIRSIATRMPIDTIIVAFSGDHRLGKVGPPMQMIDVRSAVAVSDGEVDQPGAVAIGIDIARDLSSIGPVPQPTGVGWRG